MKTLHIILPKGEYVNTKNGDIKKYFKKFEKRYCKKLNDVI